MGLSDDVPPVCQYMGHIPTNRVAPAYSSFYKVPHNLRFVVEVHHDLELNKIIIKGGDS